MELIQTFFSSGGFIPHGHCYLWKPGLVWLHLLADLFTAIAYYCIPIAIVYFTKKREDLPFKGIFLLFSLFIILCGTTHLMDVLTLWYPIYWVSGVIKALTALVSVITVLQLLPLIPQALELPSPAQLKAANLLLTQKIESIIANVVDGVVVIDERSQIESLNSAALKMFDYTTNDLLKKNWQMLISPNAPIVTNQLSESIGVRQHGNSFPIEISLSNIDYQDRQLLIVRDITERQETANKLRSRADELEKLNLTLIATNQTLAERNQELDQFAYVVSHDLKAPLRAISTLSEWLETDLENKLPQENQVQLQLLRARVHRMYGLLNGILDYARIGRTQIALEPVSVDALLTEIVDTLAPPSGFMVEVASPLPTFKTSRVLLRQVLTNLIDNAIKYHPNPEQGLLKISVQESENYYEFAIIDNGEGIDPQYHQKVFTIFQTLEARDTRESIGVGLAIVKKIVRSEGGEIHLTSEVGKGSTFSFTWRK
jgi:PAS domain S-box-containing protein